jgi:hypothetical protein
MVAEYQVRQWLIRYLSCEVSLDQLEDWLVKRSWNMHLDSDMGAQKLASAVELRLAEHSSGHLSEPELREELRSFANTYVTQLHFGNPLPDITDEGPNNVIVEVRPQVVTFPFPAGVASQAEPGYVDTSRAVVSG